MRQRKTFLQWPQKLTTIVTGIVLSPLLNDNLLLLYVPFQLFGYMASHSRREVLPWKTLQRPWYKNQKKALPWAAKIALKKKQQSSGHQQVTKEHTQFSGNLYFKKIQYTTLKKQEEHFYICYIYKFIKIPVLSRLPDFCIKEKILRYKFAVI